MFQSKVVETKHILFYFIFENRAFYAITWKNIVEPDRPQMTIWRMRIACCIPKATNTHTGCVILIAFPQQQCLHERVSLLPYTYVPCLVHSVVEQILAVCKEDNRTEAMSKLLEGILRVL